MAPISVPEITLHSGNRKKMPALGLGVGTYPFPTAETVIKAVRDAIELGYTNFDTAAVYFTEEYLGEAISQALSLGLIKSRDELFITSKLWGTDAHGDHVVPALKKTLQNLKLEYVDQYLVHSPVAMKHGPISLEPKPDDFVPLDIQSVWTAMEECQTLGLTKSIGVSNFSRKKLTDLLAFAKIPPAVNQVEMNPVWQQKKLREFCKTKGIVIAAYSPLGAAGSFWGSTRVFDSEVLKEIAKSKGKTLPQVALRWAIEQGVVVIAKSFNKERLKQNIEIFEWELSEEERKKIDEIPQFRGNPGEMLVSPVGPIKTVEELWDGED